MKDLLDEFKDVRGVPADEEWAAVVVGRMSLDGVPQRVMDRELRTVLALVDETQESPEELYGPPREWAQERLREGVASGRIVPDTAPDVDWRAVAIVAPVLAVVISLMMAVMDLVRERAWRIDLSLAEVLLPGALGLAVMVAGFTFEQTLSRHRRSVAIAASVGVVALGVAAVLGTLLLTRDVVWEAVPALTWAVVPLGYAVLAFVVERLVPEKVRRTMTLSDEDWVRELSGSLRLQQEMPEQQIDRIVGEARAHAAASGTPLVREFGAPTAYAARFSRDVQAAARRSVWYQLVLAAVASIVAFAGLIEDPSWSGVSISGLLLMILSLTSAVDAWRRSRRAGGERQGPA